MGKTASLANIGTIADSSLGFRNRLINGGMTIDQRNAGASVTANSATNPYVTDRWRSLALTGSGQFSAQQSTVAPTGFVNSLLFTSLATTSVGSSDAFGFRQPIEGVNCSDLRFGTANASTVTLSFWVRSSLTGTFGGSVANNAANRSYPFSYTISAANTWEQKTITVSGDTTGTWATDNTTGMNIWFSLGVGSTKSGTAGAWAAADYRSATGATSVVGTSGATFYITGVQLEKGSTATSFDYRPYTTELQLCQRYCVNYRSAESGSPYLRYGIGASINTTQIENFFSYPVPMRVIPTLTTTGTASNYGVYESNAVTACSAVPTLNNSSSNLISLINAVVASGLTVGRGASLLSNNNNTSYLLFSAEL